MSKLHKSTVDKFPKKFVEVYKNDTFFVVQSLRTAKFWCRFKISGKYFVFWSDVWDFVKLSELEMIYKSYSAAFSDMVSDLDLVENNLVNY